MTLKRTLIMAEAGLNHNGDPALAHALVEAAREAGADVVKFQTIFNPETRMARQAPKAAYQLQNTGADESALDMVRKLVLGPEEFVALKRHAEDIGLEFLSTAFDQKCADFLRGLGLKRWKIPSGELTNLPYLRHIGASGGPAIMSTGMANLGEVETALEILEKNGTPPERITLLHCTTEYPAPAAEVNLRAMTTLRAAFPQVAGVGYSDHTDGPEIAVAAVALGAVVIEKHLTLDKTLPGPDHQASLEPRRFQEMVRYIRRVEEALGDGRKRPSPSERLNLPVARRSLFALRPIRKGEIFSEDNMGVKRPGTGISPMRWDEFYGRPATRDYDADEPL